jgi:hypothetical protein
MIRKAARIDRRPDSGNAGGPLADPVNRETVRAGARAASSGGPPTMATPHI